MNERRKIINSFATGVLNLLIFVWKLEKESIVNFIHGYTWMFRNDEFFRATNVPKFRVSEKMSY